ncbi:MAG: DUF3892 domain-containing protein [Pseudomonadota bacterium]
MADVQVTCVIKEDRNNPHEGITHIGGYGWLWTRREVIESIKSRLNTFYTLSGNIRADIVVVDGPNGPYIRTKKDSVLTDNLLFLTACSVKAA